MGLQKNRAEINCVRIILAGGVIIKEFRIGSKDRGEIFKNLQERDNNYRNIVLSRSRAILVISY